MFASNESSLTNLNFEGYKLELLEDCPDFQVKCIPNETLAFSKNLLEDCDDIQSVALRVEQNGLYSDQQDRLYFFGENGSLQCYVDEHFEQLLEPIDNSTIHPSLAVNKDDSSLLAHRLPNCLELVNTDQSVILIHLPNELCDITLLVMNFLEKTIVLLGISHSKSTPRFQVYVCNLLSNQSISVIHSASYSHRPMASFVDPINQTVWLAINNPSLSAHQPMLSHQQEECAEDLEEEVEVDHLYAFSMQKLGTDIILTPPGALLGSKQSTNSVIVASGDDALLYVLDQSVKEDHWLHCKSYPAINFIQSGKPEKRFLFFANHYAILVESKQYVHFYRHTLHDSHAPQHLLQLPTDDLILGYSLLSSNRIALLTPSTLYVISLPFH